MISFQSLLGFEETVKTAQGREADARQRAASALGADAPSLTKVHNRTEEHAYKATPEPTLTWYPGASFVEIKVPRPHLPKRDREPKSRGRIREWSAASRARMKRFQAMLTRDKMADAQFWTLTYPDDFPAPEDHDIYDGNRKAFIAALYRKYPQASGIWKLEFQQRGAAHYHLMILGLGAVELEEVEAWVIKTWYRIAHKGDKYLGLKGIKVERTRSVHGALSYLAKYMSKTDQTMPGNFSGRYWGKINVKGLPIAESKSIEVPKFTAQQILRIARKKMKKDTESSWWKRFLEEERRKAPKLGFDENLVGNRLFWEHLKSARHGGARLVSWNYKHVQVLGFGDDEWRNPFGFYPEWFQPRLTHPSMRRLPRRWKARNNDCVRLMCNADAFIKALSRTNNPASSFLAFSKAS